jgi:nucleoid-associated protein YgaU
MVFCEKKSQKMLPTKTRLEQRLAALPLLALLAACATQAPPPAAPRASAIAWRFDATPERCTARAAFPEEEDDPAALTLVAERGGGMSFTFSNTAHPLAPRPPGLAATLHFAATDGGGWTIPAALEAPRVVDTELPLNETTLAEARTLLAGGTLSASGHVRGLPALALPPAGDGGANFLTCAARFAGLAPE